MNRTATLTLAALLIPLLLPAPTRAALVTVAFEGVIEEEFHHDPFPDPRLPLYRFTVGEPISGSFSYDPDGPGFDDSGRSAVTLASAGGFVFVQPRDFLAVTNVFDEQPRRLVILYQSHFVGLEFRFTDPTGTALASGLPRSAASPVFAAGELRFGRETGVGGTEFRDAIRAVPAATPEPATWAMALTALVIFAVGRVHSRRAGRAAS